MAYGDHPSDDTLRSAWKSFCAQLENAGNEIFKDYNPATAECRVDALRFLTQNLGQAFDLALETRDTRYPELHAFCNPTRKLGSDAADFVYLQAWIDGESVYRISGHRGTARFLNFTVQGARPEKQPGTDWPSLHEPFGDIPEANLFGHQLHTAWDGSFELYIGGAERGPNWLPTTPQTRKLFLRQGFDAWDEEPARLRIERIDMDGPRPLPSLEVMTEAIGWAGNFVESLMKDWPDHPYLYSPFVDPEQLNRFPIDPDAAVDESDRQRGRAAANMCWQVARDEALIIEFAATDSFWMMSLMGVFFNSFDYRYRPVSYTPARTHVNSDGRIRLILCHDDPGYHNWLDTQGFERGNLTYRNLLSNWGPPISTRLVKRSELTQALPEDTATISREARLEQMKTRFHSIQRRYSL